MGFSLPELPEIAAALARLAPHVVGKRIHSIAPATAKGAALLHGDPALLPLGSTLVAVERRGKVGLLTFDAPALIAVRFGMSGRLVAREPATPHDHIAVRFIGGGVVTFADHRRFGRVYVVPIADARMRPPLARLGPDALDPGPDASRLRGCGRRMIKDVLLDQSVVAGLGNIYACEALFRAGIDPRRRSASLDRDTVERLAVTCRQLLQDAVASGGATLEDYRGTEGEAGAFERHFAVYEREGQACTGCTCGTGAVLRIRQSGRSTWYCPHKQL